ILKDVKSDLENNFLKSMYERMQESHKGRLYLHLRDSFQTSNFLMSTLPRSLKIVVTRFLSSNHRLPVETGAWARPPIEFSLRLCLKCTEGDVGDEYHYLFVCPFFRQERIMYLNEFFRN